VGHSSARGERHIKAQKRISRKERTSVLIVSAIEGVFLKKQNLNYFLIFLYHFYIIILKINLKNKKYYFYSFFIKQIL
jgi:uncharacterized membrane protein